MLVLELELEPELPVQPASLRVPELPAQELAQPVWLPEQVPALEPVPPVWPRVLRLELAAHSPEHQPSAELPLCNS